MDKIEIAFITIVSTAIIALLMTISYEFGEASMQKEAVERNFAHYDVRSNGDTDFSWNKPTQ
jgi:hypothetical protein